MTNFPGLKRTIRLSVLVMSCLLALVIPARGQEKVLPLEHRRKVVFRGKPEIFLSLLGRTHAVTIGLENDPRYDMHIMFEATDVDFYGALDAFVRAAPWLRWRKEGDTIDVIPTNGGAHFLDIAQVFPGVSGVSQREAIDQLLSLPGLHEALNRSGVSFTSFEREEEPGSEISLPAGTRTVRRGLHEIVKRSGTKLWVLRWADRGKSFSLGTPARFRPRA